MRASFARTADLATVTVKKGKQWAELRAMEKHALVANCERYLIRQLKVCSPRLVIAHGIDVFEWFKSHSSTFKEERNYSLIGVDQSCNWLRNQIVAFTSKEKKTNQCD
jgi:hypothetical protein